MLVDQDAFIANFSPELIHRATTTNAEKRDQYTPKTFRPKYMEWTMFLLRMLEILREYSAEKASSYKSWSICMYLAKYQFFHNIPKDLS